MFLLSIKLVSDLLDDLKNEEEENKIEQIRYCLLKIFEEIPLSKWDTNQEKVEFSLFQGVSPEIKMLKDAFPLMVQKIANKSISLDGDFSGTQILHFFKKQSEKKTKEFETESQFQELDEEDEEESEEFNPTEKKKKKQIKRKKNKEKPREEESQEGWCPYSHHFAI